MVLMTCCGGDNNASELDPLIQCIVIFIVCLSPTSWLKVPEPSVFTLYLRILSKLQIHPTTTGGPRYDRENTRPVRYCKQINILSFSSHPRYYGRYSRTAITFSISGNTSPRPLRQCTTAHIGSRTLVLHPVRSDTECARIISGSFP